MNQSNHFLYKHNRNLFICGKTTIEYSFYKSHTFANILSNFLETKEHSSFIQKIHLYIPEHQSFIFIHSIHTQSSYRKQYFASNALQYFKSTFSPYYSIVLFAHNFHQEFNLNNWYANRFQFVPIFESIDSTALISKSKN